MSRFTHLIFIALSLSSQVFAQSNATTGSRGNTFNPDISFNSLFLYQNSNRGNNATDPSPNGFSLQEAELQLTADVDPYLRAVGLLAIHKEAGAWELEPEEVYGETLGLSVVTLKFGKFKAALGKYNTLHSHALPFIDQQLINTVLLGDEGLNGEGVSASFLLPLNWYSDFTIQGFGGQTEAGDSVQLFKGTSPNGILAVGRFKNLWDFTDDLTMEFGLSAANGPNDSQGPDEPEKKTSIFGSDLTFKWRPSSGGKYAALIWSTEYLDGQKNLNPEGDVRIKGTSSFIQWQLSERWWVQGRTEHAEVLESAFQTSVTQSKNTLMVAHLPTEFSAIRLQYDQLRDSGEKPEEKISLQLNLSIGAHPAHAY